MWDESLPAYDGSFEHNMIVFTLYFRVFLYYIISMLGLLTLGVIIISPFVGFYMGWKSVKIKIKTDKEHKHIKKKRKAKEESNQNVYLSHLDSKLKKKRKY